MLKLATIFQNGMIMQRFKKQRIWGESDCKQVVTVYLNKEQWGEEQQVDEGKFSLVLPAADTAINATIEVKCSTGDNLIIENVDFGEVWIAGGQSNMVFPLKFIEDGKRIIEEADDDHLRYYNVAQYAFEGEENDGFKDESRWNKWFPCKSEYIESFSAIGICYAQELRRELGVPVGIVGCNWGGTSASTWIDKSILESDPELQVYINDYEKKINDLNLEEYYKNSRKLRSNTSKTDLTLKRYLLEGSHRLLLSLLNPYLCRMMSNPMGPNNENRPGGLYGTMLNRIAGYSCKGVLWYQGESDEHHAELYRKLFTTLIECWRRDWMDEKLPFIFVQLAPFEKWLDCSGKNYPELRYQQELVSKYVPNTWMASIMDLGMRLDIHPKKKTEVAHRMALIALGKIYTKDILCLPPEIESITRTGNRIELSFINAGEGLRIKGKELNAFKIMVDGRTIKDWKARISDKRVIINSKSLDEGKTLDLFLGYEPYCEVNLYNSAGLPAKPFSRTVD